MKDVGSFSIPDVQTKFNMSYGDTRELFRSLEKGKKIELTEGISYLWIDMEEVASTPPPEEKKSDDDSFDFSAIFKRRREHNAALTEKLVKTYLKRKGYTEENGTAKLNISVALPDGEPFEIGYHFEDGEHYLTDKGCIGRYLRNAMPNIDESVRERLVKCILRNMCEDSLMLFGCGQVMKNVTRCADDEDIRSAVFYMLDVLDNFILNMNERLAEREFGELDSYMMSRTTEDLIERMCEGIILDGEEPEEADPVYEAMRRIALCHSDMSRRHAVELAERLVTLAVESGSENRETFERLLDTLTAMTDFEFRALQLDLWEE